MPRERKTLRAEDLINGALVQSSKTGRVYRLGPPKKKNVNLNVVNHCQLYTRAGVLLLNSDWYNLSNLRAAGFKLYTPIAGQMVLRRVDKAEA